MFDLTVGSVEIAPPGLRQGSGISPNLLSAPAQLVAIDARLPDLPQLLAGLQSNTAVVVLDPTRDGVEQLSSAIAQFSHLDAVHLLGHGQAGEIQFGSTTLTADGLTNYAPQLRAWRSHLTPEADLLLYGCNVAAEPQPSALLAGLADLTGADVAASDDLTGRGGDWQLEVATGAIDSRLPFDLAAASAYAGTLATINITTTVDSLAIDGLVSLREAINAIDTGLDGGDVVNASVDLYGTNDTIVLPAGTYAHTILGSDDTNSGGDFDIDKALILRGAGADSTIIRTAPGGENDRLLHVTAAVPLTIEGLTISDGNSIGPILGGGIFANGNLTVTNSKILNNFAGGGGGGIYATGNVSLTNSTVSGNQTGVGVGVRGGGIYGKGAVTLINSTVNGNSANDEGGGIYSTVAVALTNSTASGNSANDGGGIFGGAVTLTNSTVSGNSANNGGGGIVGDGAVTLISSTVSSNSSVNDGGGILGSVAVTLTNSTVSGNSSVNTDGGGIWGAGAVTLTNSTVSGNSANNDGGGIVAGAVTLTNSTVSGNSASGDGGGISAGAVTLTNSTVSGNSANINGGGIRGGGAVTLTNSTIAFNTATTNSGGLYRGAPGATTLRNSIVARNTNATAPDFGGNFGGTNTFSNNLIGSTVGLPITLNATNQANLDPLLGGLSNNGGTTLTHLPQTGSPAIDKGDNAFSPGGTDQRGAQRIFGGTIDLGAVEAQAPPPTPLVPEIELRDATTGAIVPISGLTTIDFGSTRVGTPIARSFSIRNLGDGPLDLTSLTLPNGFTLQSPTLPNAIAPGSLLDLVIRLSAQTPGSFTGLLTLSNNDSDESPYFFTLTGNVGQALPGLQTFTVALARPPFPNPDDRPRRRISLASGRFSAVGSNEDEELSTDLAESVIFGFGGDDVLLGSAGGDRLYGNAGRDFAYGRGGNDWLDGGTGDDAMRGNEGDDRLFGGTGNDYLLGDAGNDYLYAGPGTNLLDGAAGNDEISGGPDADAIWGDAGSDRLLGGAGNDTILGEADDDVIQGEDGNDALNGNEGNDVINGGLGDDTILGEAGVDLLDGGTGNDVLVGGEGGDRFVLRRPVPGQPGVQFIADFEAGSDGFLLVGGLTFEELAIATNEFGQPVIQLAATGETLALLQRSVALGAGDFAVA